MKKSIIFTLVVTVLAIFVLTTILYCRQASRKQRISLGKIFLCNKTIDEDVLKEQFGITESGEYKSYEDHLSRYGAVFYKDSIVMRMAKIVILSKMKNKTDEVVPISATLANDSLWTVICNFPNQPKGKYKYQQRKGDGRIVVLEVDGVKYPKHGDIIDSPDLAFQIAKIYLFSLYNEIDFRSSNYEIQLINDKIWYVICECKRKGGIRNLYYVFFLKSNGMVLNSYCTK